MTDLFDLGQLRHDLAAAPDGGKLKPLGLKKVVVGERALGELPGTVSALLAERAAGAARYASRPVAVLSDLTLKRYGAGELLDFVTSSLAPFGVRRVQVGTPGHGAHADEATVAKATADCAGASCLVAIGSGTVADIGKVAAAAAALPYVIVQSAASVNGFADDRSVLLLNGVKRTVPSTWADALIVDTEVLAGAPAEMNLAGLGDLIAMFTAPADWYLASILGMDDSYSPTVVALTRDQGADLLRAAPLLAGADRDSLGKVARALTLSGISMGVAGTTAPCSGMEHVVSHLLEMTAAQDGSVAALHGAQVGVASIVAAALWSQVLGELAHGGLLRARSPEPAEAEQEVRAAFVTVDPSGSMGEECWRDYERKLSRWARAADSVEEAARNWPAHERVLRQLLAAPDALVSALHNAGAPVGFADLEPPPDAEVARWAVGHCHLMRDRFSVADMASFLGIWDEESAGVLVEQASALAGAPVAPGPENAGAAGRVP